MNVRLLEGDCRESLKGLASDSIDSCVTDPPYALVSVVKRFGGTNAAPSKGNDAYMRASAGFMGKTWDTGETAFSTEFWTEVYRVLKPGAFLCAFGATRGYHRMACAIEDAGFEIRDSLAWLYGTGFPKSHNLNGDWEGWGTALKPAFEPIVLARKPLSESTVAANVLRWRTGAINIDASRVPGQAQAFGNGSARSGGIMGMSTDRGAWEPTAEGRFPANVVHDGSDEVINMFPNTKDGVAGKRNAQNGDVMKTGLGATDKQWGGYGGSGSAARFFYSAKASKADRAGSKHPTVKPIALKEWLCTLVTPPGGTILDPFAGSGTTGAAARNKGFNAILCERETEYIADIKQRLGIATRMPWEKAPIDFPWL